MIRCVKVILVLLSIIISHANVKAKPQDIKDAAILALAQAKDTIDNGAAASDKKEIEFFGAKIKNEMEIGIGDAARSKRSNQKSATLENKKIIEPFGHNTVNSHEKIITKRALDDNAIVDNNPDNNDYSSSFSSSSSSSSSSLYSSESKEN